MKSFKYGKYVAVGLTAFLVIAASLLTFFALFHFSTIRAVVSNLLEILMPFIVGAVIAYLLAPLYNLLLRNTEDSLLRRKMAPKRARGLATGAATMLSILAALCLLSGLAALVVPSFITSLTGLLNSMQEYMNQLTLWVNNFFADNPNVADTLEEYLNTGSDQLSTWLSEKLLPGLEGLTSSGLMSTGVSSIFGVMVSGALIIYKVAKNAILGFIVAAYLLVGKTNMIAHCKRLLYSLLPVKTANRIVFQCRYIHEVFGRYIRGKLLDSLLVGIICFVGTALLRIPYSVLISVLMGVTNIIPFFGPFIGAIPSVCLVLLTDPIKGVTFGVFILAIQQFDANILEPRILGGTVGMSSFWVLFSIILFGGLFGVVGMVIGVPVFAVICSLVDTGVTGQLKKKHLSVELEDYLNLERVEEHGDEARVYAKMKDPTKK